jgi:hypothetical protein
MTDIDPLDRPFIMGAAIGLGYELAKDELPFFDGTTELDEEEEEIHFKPQRIPLVERFTAKRKKKTRPITRWLDDVLAGRKQITDELEYTQEEWNKILEQEGLDE